MRPGSSTAADSVMSNPAPDVANLPRCIKCQSLAQPSTALYWSIGPTTIRLSNVNPCRAIGEKRAEDDVEIAKGMLAGGMIGVFIATHWSFAAEVGGCQAEGGSAAAMSAAAVINFVNGSLKQAVGAASMAMQNMLGLICDPVANRVEVPCLGKNVLAASNALTCANMALAGYDAVIPLDETIAAAKNSSFGDAPSFKIRRNSASSVSRDSGRKPS